VVFEPPKEAIDPANHPFAALRGLQPDGTAAAVKKSAKSSGEDTDS
jgi:hypothetical protein